MGLFNYCVKSREKLLVAARGDECDGLESTTEFKKRMTDEGAEEVGRKELHGQFFRQTDGVASNASWTWLQQGYLKKETEGLLMAAQTQLTDHRKILCAVCADRKIRQLAIY